MKSVYDTSNRFQKNTDNQKQVNLPLISGFLQHI